MAPPRTFTASVRRSVAEAQSVMPGLDDGMIRLALEYAAALDFARVNEDPATYAKRLGWLGPHLGNVLKALGVSAEGRRQVGAAVPVPRTGRLAELRAAHDNRPAG
jgi:hypothetical protein